MDVGTLLFSFRGRLNRAKWWLSNLLLVVLYIVIIVLSLVIPSATVGTILGIAYAIVYIWIVLAAGTKRLHDINRSGAWLLVFIGGPILLFVVFIAMAGVTAGLALLGGGENLDTAALAQVGVVGLVLGLVYLALCIWALVWFGCLRGTVGANQYGPDPLAPGM